jgi:hypothetical protein
LSEFRASTKAEAARQLVLVKNEILEQSRKFNSRKTVPLLLCLEDAINNLEIEICRSQEVDKKLVHPVINLALTNFIFEWYGITNEMINRISENGFYDPSTKIELAEIQLGVFIGEQRQQDQDLKEFLEGLRSDGLIGQKPFLMGRPRLFLSKIPGSFCFVMNSDVSKHVKQNFVKILHFGDKICQRGLLETMVHRTPEGTRVRFNDNGLLDIVYPDDFAVESLLEKIGLTPRAIESISTVREWNSNFRDAAIETARTLKRGKGRDNISKLERELDETYKAYHSMKDFPETFEKLFGVDMEAFFGVSFELECLCYKNVHCVGIWKLSNLLSMGKISEKYGFEKTSKVVELLRSEKIATGRKTFLVLEDSVMTNFLRLGTRRSALLDECFNEVYDNNLKGQAFEEACRKTLRENGIKTISKRVDITEPILPAEVSIALWGRQKSRTDIDVLACFNNNVLIIECKENKFKLPSISEKNQFKKYLIEHFHRVKWISSNLKKFENYVGLEEWLSLAITDNQPLYLFPLLVSSTFVETDEFKAAPLLTFIELKELVSKEWAAKTKGKTGELNIEIGPRVIKLPWFSVTDAKLISS